MNSDNNARVPKVVPVTSSDTVYFLNPFSGPNLVEGVMPINVSPTAPTSVGVPELVAAVSNATH